MKGEKTLAQWSEKEIKNLNTLILKKIYNDLKPLGKKKILVLCSSKGDVAFWLAKRTKNFKGKIIGLELSNKCLKRSIKRVKDMKLEEIIEFHKAKKYKIPYPDKDFDALISEFIIFPTPIVTEIGQNEMARTLKKEGKMILTDVITIKKLPGNVQNAFKLLGLDYLCKATRTDFKEWMKSAGLKNIKVIDLTPMVRQIWKERCREALTSVHRRGCHYLLDSEFALGKTIFYIYVSGEKP